MEIPSREEALREALVRYELAREKERAYNFVRRRAIAHALRSLKNKFPSEYQALLNRETREHLKEYCQKQKGGV